MTSTADLMARLHRHYIDPSRPLRGGVLVPEVAWNGPGGSRRCDAVYVGFTSASGRMLVGHEVKVSRSDWRRELDKVGKADEWFDQCHAWYVVAPSTDIVPVEELPPGWGLLTINPRSKTRLTTTVKAAVKPNHQPSWNAVRSVIARWDTLRADDLYHARNKLRDQVMRDAEQQIQRRMQGNRPMTPTEQARLDALDQLEQVAGVKISEFRWAAGDGEAPAADVGLALALVLGMRKLPERYQLETAARHAKDTAALFDQLLRESELIRAAVRPPQEEPA